MCVTPPDSSMEEKRERLVGLTLGKAYVRDWAGLGLWNLSGIWISRGDCQDFEAAKIVTYSWKGRDRDCPR